MSCGHHQYTSSFTAMLIAPNWYLGKLAFSHVKLEIFHTLFSAISLIKNPYGVSSTHGFFSSLVFEPLKTFFIKTVDIIRKKKRKRNIFQHDITFTNLDCLNQTNVIFQQFSQNKKITVRLKQ